MKTAGIICEYNPFHNGHAYMIGKLKEEGFDRVVCFMSGNFTQRGEPAVIDKYIRARGALKAGADLVLEMPVIFATSSAADFANCGVSMAAQSGFCNALCFGVEKEVLDENGNLRAIGSAPVDEEILRKFLSLGFPYPDALSRATGQEQLPPNAILAYEYERAIRRFAKGKLVPYPIERIGDGYATETPSGSPFASATAIRGLLEKKELHEASLYMPPDELIAGEYVDPEQTARLSSLTFPDSLSVLLSDRLLREPDLTRYLDVSREIADRLKKRKDLLLSYESRIADTKTRQYTYTRIARALLHIVLSITKEDAENLKEEGFFRYWRVLAYRKDSKLLSEISIDKPVITRIAQLLKFCPEDIYYDQIYYALTQSPSEYVRNPYII